MISGFLASWARFPVFEHPPQTPWKTSPKPVHFNDFWYPGLWDALVSSGTLWDALRRSGAIQHLEVNHVGVFEAILRNVLHRYVVGIQGGWEYVMSFGRCSTLVISSFHNAGEP